MGYRPEEIEEKFNKILSEIRKGRSVSSILKEKGMPCRDTFDDWLNQDSLKIDKYTRAKEIGIDAKFESIEQDYSEEPQRDPETGKIDPAWVNLQRLKIDAKKWELSKLLPKKYGDRLELDNRHSGEITNIISLGSGKKPDESDS
jgi:hypothetical protein